MIDLTGQRFGRWTVIEEAPKDCRTRRMWLCRCDCGTERPILQMNLRQGLSNSCGCLREEAVARRFTKHGQGRAGKETPEYKTWKNIKSRCSNPNLPEYKNYGGRGIRVCSHWLASFENFFSDMGPRPGPKFTIERKDTDGDYCPENCYWATRLVQANNTRANRHLTYLWEVHTVAEWERILGLPKGIVRQRLEVGWSVERALTEPSTRPGTRPKRTTDLTAY